ncbi:hypothetical protein [Alicyclobacillus acidiphilus]|uniref:hypothetical protein n=1 Tax=Alicyclobacillus acidiphilus TaxID=182455 RepID=UPI0012ECEA51|nr:hypothetical protein [Alicyclobacillus acidiphilus]
MKSRPSLIYVEANNVFVPFDDRASDFKAKSAKVLGEIIRRAATLDDRAHRS